MLVYGNVCVFCTNCCGVCNGKGLRVQCMYFRVLGHGKDAYWCEMCLIAANLCVGCNACWGNLGW